MAHTYISKRELSDSLVAAIESHCQGAFGKLSVSVDGYVCPHSNAGQWDGAGNRDDFFAVDLNTGEVSEMVRFSWSAPIQSAKVQVPEGFAVLEFSRYGVNKAVRIYVNKANLAPLLAAPSHELSPAESIALYVTRSYVSAARREYAGRYGLTLAQFDAAKESLRVKGLMNKQGALTIDGKNAAAKIKEPKENEAA